MSTNERLDKHDRQIAEIRELMVQTRRDIRSLAGFQLTLAASQKKTDASLQALISALRRSGGNGHSKAKVDLQ